LLYANTASSCLYTLSLHDALPISSGLRIKLSNHIETCPTANIFIVDTDGKNTIRLTKDDALNAFASWSPDGKQIAFMSNREGGRSEEHTSELQSRFDLVCRLLLEK